MEDHQNLSIGVLREALSHILVGRVEINEARCEVVHLNDAPLQRALVRRAESYEATHDSRPPPYPMAWEELLIRIPAREGRVISPLHC